MTEPKQTPTWDEAIAAFCRTQHMAGRAMLTVEQRKSSLRRIGREMGMEAAGKRWLGKWRVDRLQDALAAMHVQGRTLSTISAYAGSLRVFGEFLLTRGYTDTNPAARIQLPKVPAKHRPLALTLEEFRRLLDVWDPESWEEQRNRLLCVLFVQTGARAHELLESKAYSEDGDVINYGGLTLGQIYEDRIVVIGKGHKIREIPLSSNARKAIDEWLDLRYLIVPDRNGDDDPLWITADRKALTRQAFYKLYKRACARAEIPKEKRTIHILRHTCLTWLADSGAPLHRVAQFAGHSDPAITMRYYIGMNTQKMAADVAKIPVF